jgi:phosphoribosylformylglycinamidine cyclo-ligase
MGSNGLTSARHDVFHKTYASKYPESFDGNVPNELVYSGPFKVTDTIPDAPINVGKLVLSPTRTYAPIVIALLKTLRPQIHGMIHCSGGAQTKILHFIEQLHVVKNNLFDLPPLFKVIQSCSGTDWREMFKVFNMGHRMEIYLEGKFAEEVIQISKSFGVEARIIGYVAPATEKKVTIQSNFGEFVYP